VINARGSPTYNMGVIGTAVLSPTTRKWFIFRAIAPFPREHIECYARTTAATHSTPYAGLAAHDYWPAMLSK
jgi:hypothetical protein